MELFRSNNCQLNVHQIFNNPTNSISSPFRFSHWKRRHRVIRSHGCGGTDFSYTLRRTSTAWSLATIRCRRRCGRCRGTEVWSTANWTISDPYCVEAAKDFDFQKCCFFPWKTALFSVARCPFTSSNRHIPVQMGSTVTHLVFFFFSVCKHIIFLFSLVLFLLRYSCQHRALIYICFVSFPLHVTVTCDVTVSPFVAGLEPFRQTSKSQLVFGHKDSITFFPPLCTNHS